MFNSWGHSWPWHPILVLCNALKTAFSWLSKLLSHIILEYVFTPDYETLLKEKYCLFFLIVLRTLYGWGEIPILHPKLSVSLWMHFQLTMTLLSKPANTSACLIWVPAACCALHPSTFARHFFLPWCPASADAQGVSTGVKFSRLLQMLASFGLPNSVCQCAPWPFL